MKKFEPGNLYQPAAQSQGFRPITAPDITPLLRENERRREQDAAAQQRQVERQQQFDRENLDYVNQFNTKQAEQIAALSQTFADAVSKGEEYFLKSQEEYGLMKAYTEGIPDEITEAYQLQTATEKVYDAQAKQAAANAQADGAPTGVSKMLRGMSIWARKGYAKGVTAQAGANYPLIKQQIAASVSIDVPGRSEPLTFKNAETEAEFAAVQAEINNIFLSQFRGVPVSILNETVFPQMKAHDTRDAIKFGDKLKKNYEAGKLSDFQTEVDAAVRNPDPELGFQQLMEIFQRYSPEFGGMALTREKFYTYYKDMHYSEEGVPPEFNARLTQEDHPNAFQFSGKDKGIHTYAKLYKGEITTLRAEQVEHDANMKRLQIEEGKYVTEIRRLDKQFADEELQNGPPTEERLLEIKEEYRQAGIPSMYLGKSTYLENAESKTQRDVEADKVALSAIVLSKKGGISARDLKNYHPLAQQWLKQTYGDRIIEESLEAPNRDQYKKKASSLARTLRGDQGYNADYNTTVFEQNILDRFDQMYAFAITKEGQTPGAVTAQNVWNQVLLEASEKDDNGKLVSPLLEETKPTADYKIHNAQRTFKANKHNISLLIPSLADDAAELAGWNPGKESLPPIWRQAAQYMKYPDGTHPTAWELANAQFAANNKGAQLPMTAHQTRLSQMSARHKELLGYKPSPGRYTRVAIESGWKPFLDLIASKESAAYGHYNAYNLAGSDYGHTAHGSSNSAKDLRYGKPLVELKLKDVLKLGAEEKIHAAGRYQFVHATLKEVVGQMGLTGEETFDEELQDALAIHRALWRVENGGKNVYNFGNEWIGLQDPAIRRKLQAELDRLPTASPYNRVEYMHPSLLKRLNQ